MAPDLSRFAPEIQRHIRLRQQWHDRLLDRPDATAAERHEADGELACLYHAYELYEPAEALYRRLRERDPTDARWPYYLGQLYRTENRLAESVTSFEQALLLEPENVPTLVRLSEVLLDLDRSGEAEPLLERALRLEPQNAAAHVRLGEVLAGRRDWAGAIEHFQRALELQPESTAIHTPLGIAYRSSGQQEEARRHLVQAGDVEVSLDDPRLLRIYNLSKGFWDSLQLAKELRKQGEHAAALEELRRSIAADPLAAEPRLELGRGLAADGDLTRAREQLELAASLDPHSASIQVALGDVLTAAGQLQQALAHYDRGLELEPGNGLAHFAAGRALQSADRLEEALAHYTRAAELLGPNPVGLLGAATVLVELGRCRSALETLEAGLARVPNQGVWAHALARTLAACPRDAAVDLPRALAITESLLAARPSVGHAAAVAMTLAALGRYDEAAQLQRRAVEIAESSGWRDLAASLAADLERYRRGVPRRVPWRRDEMALF